MKIYLHACTADLRSLQVLDPVGEAVIDALTKKLDQLTTEQVAVIFAQAKVKAKAEASMSIFDGMGDGD